MALGLSAALAALGDDATTNPQPMTSQVFVWKAGLANLKEIHLGQLAEDRSTNSDVQSFARRMIHDHTRANERLDKIAQREDLTVPPTNSFYIDTNSVAGSMTAWTNEWDMSSAGPGSQNMKGAEELMMDLHSPTNVDRMSVQYLQSLPEPQFDLAYANQMVEDHAKAIATFESATNNLEDRALKKYADKTLPMLQEHYRLAQDLQNKLNGTQSANGYNNQESVPERKTGSGL